MEKIIDSQIPTALVLLRNDLRVHDQLPLEFAKVNKIQIIPIFIHDEIRQGKWKLGKSSKWWLHHSLTKLQSTYADHGHTLKLFKGDALQIIDDLVRTCSVKYILYNKCYEKYNRDHEKDIKDMYTSDSLIKIVSFNGNIMNDPDKILNNQGSHFKVFTPFYKKFISVYENMRAPLEIDLSEIPVFMGTNPPSPAHPSFLSPCTTDELGLLDPTLDPSQYPQWWTPGEEAGLAKLEAWLPKVKHYKALRDFPFKKATSRMSPHYHFGEVSPYLAWSKVKKVEGQKKDGVEQYLFEVGWREFSYYLLYYVPQ
jgi:deoxyribodipyrimidine photo-lyase